jgi:DNA replication and repair protein RecF
MRIVSLSLKNFRCFATLQLNFDGRFALIQGPNGIGKTSILEALHFACYLRSFKTHMPKELIYLTHEGFSITIALTNPQEHEERVDIDTVAVHLAGSKRAVKINQKPVTTYKELRALYKVVTITEDDLDLIKGAPAIRRAFIDQLITIIEPNYTLDLRKYKATLENRNALLSRGGYNTDSYRLWTQQLLAISGVIQQKRQQALIALQAAAQKLAYDFFGPSYSLELLYEYAKPYSYCPAEGSVDNAVNVDDFLNQYPQMVRHESGFRRSLFGAHLDDIRILFQEKTSRAFASRGQQKLLVFLLKLAQIDLISTLAGTLSRSTIFLIDDFMTDFDEAKIDALLPLMSKSASQIIITSPLHYGLLYDKLLDYDAQIVSLDQ